jgi:hypothetical protein
VGIDRLLRLHSIGGSQRNCDLHGDRDLGGFAFAIPPVMQASVVATAEQVAPDALATASGFNIAAFNLGYQAGPSLEANC